MARKFIQKAIKRPGALRMAAKRRGLLTEEEDALSESDLDKMEAEARRTKNTRLLRQVLFARTLKGISR